MNASVTRSDSQSIFNHSYYLNKCTLALAVTGIALAILGGLSFGHYGLPSSLSVAVSLTALGSIAVISTIALRIRSNNILNDFHNRLQTWGNCERESNPNAHVDGAINQIIDAYKNRSNVLSLSANQLQTLPPEIGSLTHLEHLDLSQNQLQTLPPEIGSLRQLEHLRLSGNQLQALPPQIGSLRQLECLNLNDNQLQTLPPQIRSLTQLQRLFISNNQLQTLPSDIRFLTQLRTLDLSQNQLQTLSPEIGSLTQLERFYLSNNQLQTLPSEIGSLTQLWQLDLSQNIFQALPPAIISLIHLKHLYLSQNQLQTLPSEIGFLTHLEQLNLSQNQLQTLPSEIGSLTQLWKLDLSKNPNLRELPVSLGDLPELMYIDIDNTAISSVQRDTILNACTRLREAVAHSQLPDLLNLWKGYAQLADLDFSFIDSYTDSEKQHLYEWLIRLRQTADFRGSQTSLAKLTCQMVATLNTHPNFKESFFSQIASNLVACEDRSAMAFNEIYTTWTLATMARESSLKDKLKILVGIAKTLALRTAVANAISHRESQNFTIEESVEIFLYFETVLKQKLELVTAINYMTYSQIGKVDWITSEELACQVSETYIDHLMDIPSCETLMNQDSEFMVAKQALLVAYEKARDRKRPDAETLAADDQLKKDVRQLTIKWVEKAMQLSA